MNIRGLQYSLPDGVKLLPAITGKEGPLREVEPGEMDIFSKNVVDYDPGHELYLGGEGMLATADGYADFCRMMLNGGVLNGYRFLDEASIETMSSPHVNTDNPSWGYDGFNLWVTGDSVRIKGWGDSGIWQGGGYEGTQYWIDNKRGFTGVVMTQVFWLQKDAWSMSNRFRGELYRDLLEKEENKQVLP
jgi:CubicO group peptidase (beta-lactamase class C family)